MSEAKADTQWVVGETEPLANKYEMGSEIGQPGQFGQAFVVKHKETGAQRAVKVISKNRFRQEADRVFHFQQLRGEIKIMQEMKHDNIIALFEVFESLGHLYIVMECCVGGELFDRIKEQPEGSFSEHTAAGILRQIIAGLEYMHSNKIAHCDLKPDNFLFLEKTPDSPLKIIDFGMSKHVTARKYLHSFRGTSYYVAPEVLDGKYTEHCDIWSFGVVMFVMLFGYPPFHAKNDELIFKKIRRGFVAETKKGYGAWFPKDIQCSEDAKDLIGRCLDQDYVRRPTSAEVLKHKFFVSVRSKEPLGASVIANLQQFTSNTKFKLKVLNVMADKLSDPAELEEMKATFKAMDVNNDGTISTEELMTFLKNSGVSGEVAKEQMADMMKNVDMDGDGTISYEELVLTLMDRKIQAKEERLWSAFCKLDKDLDGEITATEIMDVLKVSKEEAEKYIQEIDVNKDGKITYDEFSAMWMAREEL